MSSKIKRVLITGHQGYLGSVMASFFAKAGLEVVGIDTGYFQECTLMPDETEIETIPKDIREVEPKDLEGFDAVVHLAALSNDPLGNLNPKWTEEINYEASIQLARHAKQAGVKRFLFSSSCIMYGMSKTTVANEETPLDPKTEYALSKVKSERAISGLTGDHFSPTFLRNGTVYGLSPRMRFDTVFNHFMGQAVTTGKVVVESDGKPWRPVIHIQDVARAFLTVLEAPIVLIHNQIFNNGANHLNYQIMDLARTVVETVPGCRLAITASPSADQRTYQADFTKFARAFPSFVFKWNIKDGARELYDAFKSMKLSQADFDGKRFTRLKWLRHLLETGFLDDSLHWRKKSEAGLNRK